jgi:hypothetical protein
MFPAVDVVAFYVPFLCSSCVFSRLIVEPRDGRTSSWFLRFTFQVKRYRVLCYEINHMTCRKMIFTLEVQSPAKQNRLLPPTSTEQKLWSPLAPSPTIISSLAIGLSMC